MIPGLYDMDGNFFSTNFRELQMIMAASVSIISVVRNDVTDIIHDVFLTEVVNFLWQGKNSHDKGINRNYSGRFYTCWSSPTNDKAQKPFALLCGSRG